MCVEVGVGLRVEVACGSKGGCCRICGNVLIVSVGLSATDSVVVGVRLGIGVGVGV